MGRLIILFIVLGLAGCTILPPPKNTDNICSIFAQYPEWYRDAARAEKRYGTPIQVLMSFMYQESGFRANARTPRKKLIFNIPSLSRVSSAYGYAQALNGTWKEYQRQVNRIADRNNFSDAIDFMSWYSFNVKGKIGIKQYDAFNLYLAYVEGMGGYIRKTYKNKKWLIDTARKVQRRAWLYKQQFRQCYLSLQRGKHWYKV